MLSIDRQLHGRAWAKRVGFSSEGLHRGRDTTDGPHMLFANLGCLCPGLMVRDFGTTALATSVGHLLRVCMAGLGPRGWVSAQRAGIGDVTMLMHLPLASIPFVSPDCRTPEG